MHKPKGGGRTPTQETSCRDTTSERVPCATQNVKKRPRSELNSNISQSEENQKPVVMKPKQKAKRNKHTEIDTHTDVETQQVKAKMRPRVPRSKTAVSRNVDIRTLLVVKPKPSILPSVTANRPEPTMRDQGREGETNPNNVKSKSKSKSNQVYHREGQADKNRP